MSSILHCDNKLILLMEVIVNENVLSHLPNDENSVTILLRALCVLKPIRDVVVKLFTDNKFNGTDVLFDDISIQVQLSNGSIPDMIIESAKLDLCIVVEVKTSDWRELTSNQPQSYLQWLLKQKANNKYFVFLTPPNYQHMGEYINRKTTFYSGYPDACHTIKFVEISWLDIRYTLQASGLTTTCIYARDFANLIEAWYIPVPIKFSSNELKEIDMYNTTAANAVCKIFRVTEEVALEIERAGFNVIRGFSKRFFDDVGEYGMSIKYKDRDILFFGLWTAFWKDKGCPLCLGVDETRCEPAIVELFREAFPNHIRYPSPNSKYIYLVACVEKHLLTQNAVKDIAEMIINGYLNKAKELLDKDQNNLNIEINE